MELCVYKIGYSNVIGRVRDLERVTNRNGRTRIWTSEWNIYLFFHCETQNILNQFLYSTLKSNKVYSVKIFVSSVKYLYVLRTHTL